MSSDFAPQAVPEGKQGNSCCSERLEPSQVVGQVIVTVLTRTEWGDFPGTQPGPEGRGKGEVAAVPPVATPLAPATRRPALSPSPPVGNWWVLSGGRLLAEPRVLGRANALSLSFPLLS